MAAVYSKAHLIDFMRRVARRQVYSARYWRQEADVPMSIFTPRRCRAEARQALFVAGCYRRRLLVFMNEPGRYVSKERHDQIMRGQW
jgi:hypothetical protein